MKRASQGGWGYCALDRGNAGLPIFDKLGDHKAFERILADGVQHYDMRLLA